MDSCCDPNQDKKLKPSQAASDENMMYQEATSFRVPQMDCPTEEGLLRQALGRVLGVGQLEFNLVQRRLRVEHNLADPAPILAAVRAVGMEPVVESDATTPTVACSAIESAHWGRTQCVSTHASCPAPRSSSCSHAAARRSASVHGPRASKRARPSAMGAAAVTCRGRSSHAR